MVHVVHRCSQNIFDVVWILRQSCQRKAYHLKQEWFKLLIMAPASCWLSRCILALTIIINISSLVGELSILNLSKSVWVHTLGVYLHLWHRFTLVIGVTGGEIYLYRIFFQVNLKIGSIREIGAYRSTKAGYIFITIKNPFLCLVKKED